LLKLAGQEEVLCLGPQEVAVAVLGPTLAAQAEHGEVIVLVEAVVEGPQIPLVRQVRLVIMDVGMAAVAVVAAMPAVVLG